ncbi:MAG TPA: ISAzo13 family transposase [Coriobacteriia bacterium]|nr:ISAzo13 family transposase [Coriobacteriia bacterium]
MIDEVAIGERFRALAPELDERRRRLWAAAEARSHPYGGVTAVARATGISVTTIHKGLRELASGETLDPGRVRRPGGGRKTLVEKDPALLKALERLVDGDSRGDPESPLRWTAKSVRKLADGLRELGHEVHFTTVAGLLRGLGYSLQANAKVTEGKQHPDRDAQFRHINERVAAALEAGAPAISIDTKKKELVGEFKNGGRELRPKGSPIAVNTHDFPSDARGKAIPYGVLDIAANQGFVNVGITNETAQFSVASIRAWWEQLGRERYPDAKTLTITADCGGSNGNRTRLWKTELQGLANETGLAISVCHFPPGTSKWNRIEHRLWSFVSHNWRAKPLVSFEVIISLIAATTTRTGLEVYARLDERDYPTKIQVTDAELAAVELTGDEFHPEWNYTIAPAPPDANSPR